MNSLEVARIITGIPVAILLPTATTQLSSNRIHSTAIAALYGAYASLPLFPAWQFWLTIAVILALHLLIRLITGARHTPATRHSQWTAIRIHGKSIAFMATLFVATIFGALIAQGHSGLNSVFGFALNNRAAIVFNGGLAAVFLGGAAVDLIVKPITTSFKNLEISVPRLLQAGARVGHIERLLFFIFIVRRSVRSCSASIDSEIARKTSEHL